MRNSLVAKVAMPMFTATLVVAVFLLVIVPDRQRQALENSLLGELQMMASAFAVSVDIAMAQENFRSISELNALVRGDDRPFRLVVELTGEEHILAEFPEDTDVLGQVAAAPDDFITRSAGFDNPYGTGEVTVVYSRDDLNNQASGLQFPVYVALAAIVFAHLLIYVQLTNSVVKPITAAANDADRLGSGNFGPQVRKQHRSDEIGRLQQSLKLLRTRLRWAARKDRRRLVALEREVDRRTADLTNAFAELEAQAQQLKTAKEVAELASAAKNNFLSNMSHELRTPLNAILGVSEILLAERLESSQKELLAMSSRSGNHLLKLIDNILNFSRIEQGKFETRVELCEIRTLLTDSVVSTKTAFSEKTIPIFLEVDDEIAESVYIDPTQVKQIVINLLSNSIKFSESGEIKLHCGKDRQGQLEISVEDQGVGISDDALGRIFKPFEQLDPSTTRKYGGAGLGLSISKSIAERLGGSLSAQSVLGEGTKMSLKLPVEFSGASIDRSGTENIRETLKIKVLIVEDIADNSGILTAMLKNLGITPDIAENGMTALDMVEMNPYDLIFMDIQMPVLDGFETARLIRQNQNLDQPRIVFLSAYADKIHIKQALDIGGDDFLTKPISQNALMTSFRKMRL